MEVVWNGGRGTRKIDKMDVRTGQMHTGMFGVGRSRWRVHAGKNQLLTYCNYHITHFSFW